MKRPRRAKTVRKAAPKKRMTRAKRLAKIAAEAESQQRKLDPFHLPERLIPVGWGYQWKVKGEEMPPGWHAVPYSRHAHDFPRSADHQGSIVIEGLILMEALKDQIVSELHAPQKLAQDWAKDHEIAMGGTFDRGYGYPMMVADEVVTKVLKDAPPETGPDIDVTISLLVRVPAKWAAAAAYLNLTVAEYTRRRVVINQVTLAALWDGTEPIKEFPYWPTGRIVYGPVNLHISPRQDV